MEPSKKPPSQSDNANSGGSSSQCEDDILNLHVDPGDDRSACITLYREDHTIGNFLRYTLAKNPNVEYAGYDIPHPLNEVMQLRIQNFPDSPETAFETFEESLETMHKTVTYMSEIFNKQAEAFEKGIK
ncbi:uncharacterized protein LOC126329089 [Schistocerca gregaria]|uniref:uncharacterized protein LOC126329089 n=1 Tax=Schistocerca gregaria TaxID=7010 RepID=UPI00211F1606|nr:uncharacterized protein LOC126329089 [Schistocerca gregaria]